ncbi:hypothetical protein [Nocardia sp. NPDC052566]|uniref:hypothetical protein n=1 Tax=Nocardia sp. NPDC052566 TaxID=3364330 RepID=UPI0037C5574C
MNTTVGTQPFSVWLGSHRRVAYQHFIIGLGGLLAAVTVTVNLGWGSTAVVATALAVVVAVRALWRWHRGVVVSAASTVVAWAVVWVFGIATDPVDMWMGGFAYYVSYLLVISATTMSVWASRRSDFGVGRTVVLAHVAVLATVPARLIDPSLSAAPVGAMVLAGVVVWWRTRLAPPAVVSRRRARRIADRVRRVVFAAVSTVLLAAALMFSSSGTAQAMWPFSIVSNSVSDSVHDMLCGVTTPSLAPKPVGSGPESWFSNRNLAGAAAGDGHIPDNAKDVVLKTDDDMSRYTLYEIAGLRGLDWVAWQYDPGSNSAKPENCSLSAWMWTMAGNAVLTFNLYLLQATIALKELSQSTNPVAWLYDRTDSAVASMFVRVVVPGMSIAMIFSAIALGVGVVRRGGAGREILGKLGASIGVMAFGGFMFGGLSMTDAGPSLERPDGSGFYTVASTLDSTLGQLNSAIAAAVLSNINTDPNDNTFCRIPTGNEENLGQRVSSCVLAETLAYQPWAIGQFGPAGTKPIPAIAGDGTTATKPPPPVTQSPLPIQVGDGSLPCYTKFGDCQDLRAYLIAQQGGPSITQQVNSCLGGGSNGYTRGYADACIPYFAVAKQLSTKIRVADKNQNNTGADSDAPVTMYTAYAGGDGQSRLTQASSALVGTIVIAITLLTLAVITLVWHMVLFALFMLGPVTFAIGSFMGKTQVVRTWTIDVIHTFTARATYSLAMTLIIYIVCLVFRSPSIYAGMKILLVALILYGFWKLIHRIDDYIRPDGGSLNMNVAGAATQQVSQASRSYRRSRVARELRRQRLGGGRRRTPALGRRVTAAARKVGSDRSLWNAGKASARTIGGAAVGAANALGGEHKANNEAARELGYSKPRMAARRLVTGVGVGTRGAIRGGYQGARGKMPTYQRGSLRPVDSAAAKAREAKFLVDYRLLAAKEAAKEAAQRRLPRSPVDKLAARKAEQGKSSPQGKDQ